MKLSIIIPVYYNELNIADLYADLRDKVLTVIDCDYELIMVDDGSGDNSWAEMRKVAAVDDKVKLVKLSRNFGSHAAILAGLSECSGDCAAVKAADLQEPSELILDMLASWRQGNKVVLAVREDRKESFFQKLFANAYYRLVRKYVINTMPEGGFDCYLIDRKVIEVLKLLDETNSAVTLQILWAGFKTDKVYYVRQAREKGKSRWTLAKKVKLTVDSIVTFSYMPIRLATYLGFIFFLCSLIWACALFIIKLTGGIPVQGYTTLAIFILFSSGLILLILGILGEYMWRTLDAARRRPAFIIDERSYEEKKNAPAGDTTGTEK